MVDINAYKSLINNKNLEGKVNKIVDDYNNQRKTKEKTFELCMGLIEYINACLVIKKYENKTTNYSLISLIDTYDLNEEFLSTQLMKLIPIYNIVDDIGVTESDIEEMLYRADLMCGYIVEKYGNEII